MANFRYFSTVAGETVQFDRVDYRGKVAFGYHAETKQWVAIERTVEYKRQPSRHVCDARCYNATGRTMKCECSCGGKNHGKGAFNCESH